jgi:hypothetical protein
MIALMGTSAIALSLLQASVAAPTDAFRGCLRDASAKAKSEKVSGDNIETYLRTNCTAQMNALKGAIVAFRMKNGMARKAAASDADMTVEDYVASPVDKYKFMIEFDGAKPAAAAATPASQPISPQPQKP